VTAAKANHKAARTLLLQYLDLHPGKTVDADLDPAEAGIVGDTSHAEGGDSYHLGKDQIRTSGHRYSVDESPRDKRGLDGYASAMDVGYFKVTTPRGTFSLRDYSTWLVGLCRAGDPDTKDLREVIYSPDGKVVKRWDREGDRSTGDTSHLYHTHLSEYRDADGHRMIRLATRWLQHIGLIPEDDMTKDEMLALLRSEDGKRAIAQAVFQYDPGYVDKDPAKGVWPGIPDTTYGPGGNGTVGLGTAVGSLLSRQRDEAAAVAQILTALGQLDEQTARAVLDAIGKPEQTAEQTATALRAVLGDQSVPVGLLLAAG